MSERDHYEVLGLRPDADGTTVNRTYWQLARKYQAMAPSDPRAHGMLDELNEAYNVLGTPALRDEYDSDRAGRPTAAVAHDESVGAASHHSWRAPERTRGNAREGSVGVSVLQPWMIYGLGAGLAAAGAVAGAITGNLLLDALAGTGGVLIGAAAVRRWVPGMFRGRSTATVAPEESAPSAPERLPRPAGKPLGASIVRNRGNSADDLRTSTASMVGRWRTKANATPASSEPDLTLVDIFRSEQEIETQSEPLSAVLDVLRGTRNPVESR